MLAIQKTLWKLNKKKQIKKKQVKPIGMYL